MIFYNKHEIFWQFEVLPGGKGSTWKGRRSKGRGTRGEGREAIGKEKAGVIAGFRVFVRMMPHGGSADRSVRAPFLSFS